MWIGDRYVLGSAPAPRFLRSQILCRLYEKVLRMELQTEVPCVYTYVKEEEEKEKKKEKKKITYVR